MSIKPKDMAKRLGVSGKTLQRWDMSGNLKAHRTPTNRRYYTEDQVRDYFMMRPLRIEDILSMQEFLIQDKKMTC